MHAMHAIYATHATHVTPLSPVHPNGRWSPGSITHPHMHVVWSCCSWWCVSKFVIPEGGLAEPPEKARSDNRPTRPTQSTRRL